MNKKTETTVIFANPPALARAGQKTRGMFPLPLIALANVLNEKVKIEQISPDLMPLDNNFKDSLRESNADWFAITCYQETMELVVELSKIAKSAGKKVIVGGHHITMWSGSRILREIPTIDFAIVGEGEVPFKMLIEGGNLNRIPNLSWRQNGDIFTNNIPSYINDWVNQPPMTKGYSSFDYSELWKLHETIGRTGHKRPFSIMALRGCRYAIRNKARCGFCAMPLTNRLRCRSPQYFWDEIKWAVENYGVDVVWEHSDSFLGSVAWLEKSAKLRPTDMPPIWCYGRADEINDRTIELMKKIGVEHIYIGVEAGSDERLKEMSKGITISQVLRAITLCQKYGMYVQVSFIVGFPGETYSSLHDTFNFAIQCNEMNVNDIVFHEFILRKGLKWFEIIAQKYPDMDMAVLNQGRLQNLLWREFNPSVNREEALAKSKEIICLFPRSEITAWNQ